jgi:hypothetical protein
MSDQGILGQIAAILTTIFGDPIPRYTDAEASRISKVLELISKDGGSRINFNLAPNPLAISTGEKVLAVLPHTRLLEPRSVRIRQGRRSSSSIRWSRGYSTGSGGYSSTAETQDQMRQIDEGTLVLTDKKVAFLGALKTITVDLKNILGVEEFRYGVAIHREDRENVETFKISEKLTLIYREGDETLSVPFAGPILERLISRALGGARGQDITVAA